MRLLAPAASPTFAVPHRLQVHSKEAAFDHLVMGRGGQQSLPSTSGYDHLSEVPSAGFQDDPPVCTHLVCTAVCATWQALDDKAKLSSSVRARRYGT